MSLNNIEQSSLPASPPHLSTTSVDQTPPMSVPEVLSPDVPLAQQTRNIAHTVRREDFY